VLLAGCGQVANETAPADNVVGAPLNGAAAPVQASSAANGQEEKQGVVRVLIPDQYLGTYDRDVAACASAGSEERLEITQEALRFHESIGEVRGFRPGDDGSILVEADFQGEGERWRNSLRLRRGAGGTLVVTQPDGSSLARIPCP
jgi:hypothetical protein